MRHCYVCNRCGIPITNALCEQCRCGTECHQNRKEKPIKVELAEHFIALFVVSVLTAYVYFYM